jgi:sec-independent protein translocase protein TatA
MVLANIFGVEPMLIVLAIALLLFGGSKIPQLMRGIGQGVGELKKGLDESKQHIETIREEPQKPAV